LHRLHGREERYHGNVTGKDIELQLGRILRLVRPEATYPRHGSYIAQSFTKKQLGVIYHLLDEIEEQIPWEGISRYWSIQFYKAWDRVRDHRERKEEEDQLPENLA
jgi:hypothetical protein